MPITMKKNAFVSVSFQNVKRNFRNKIESNISALRANDVEAADLVRIHPKNGALQLTIGEGANNWYVANAEIEAGSVQMYAKEVNGAIVPDPLDEAIPEAADFLENTVLVALDSGELDAGLKANFEKRKAAGSKMMGKLKEKHLSEADTEVANDYPTRPDLTAVA